MKNSLKLFLLFSLTSLIIMSCNKYDNNKPDSHTDSDDSLIYDKPKISMNIVIAPDDIIANKTNKINALITPKFNAEIGEYPALITEVTIQERVPEGNNDKPSIPLFSTECFKTTDTAKQSRNTIPGKIIDASKMQTSKLEIDSNTIETDNEYRTETIFVGSQAGATMIIKMYSAILSEKGEVIAKSQEFNKTYEVK